MRARSALTFLAILVVLVLPSCARHNAPPQGVTGPQGPESPNWDYPMATGVRTANPSQSALATAESKFPLPLRVPTSLGSPTAIQVYDPATGAPASPPPSQGGFVGFALEYQYSGNPLDIIESTPSEPPSEFYTDMHTMVSQWESSPSLLHGSFTWTSLSDGTQGLITTSEDGSRSFILFLDPDNVEVQIQGPTLTADAVLTLANQVEQS